MWRGGSEAGESDLGGEVVEQLKRDEQQLCTVRRLFVPRRGGRRLSGSGRGESKCGKRESRTKVILSVHWHAQIGARSGR